MTRGEIPLADNSKGQEQEWTKKWNFFPGRARGIHAFNLFVFLEKALGRKLIFKRIISLKRREKNA